MRARTAVGVCALLGLLCAVGAAGCGGGFFHDLMASGPASATAGGGKAGGGVLSSRDEFARLLTQLQWVFIGLGIAGIVASIWVPLISTRHAVGAVAVGVGLALVRPFLVALYWPTVICLFLAAIAAVWPYAVGLYTWARVRILGHPTPVLTGGIASFKALFMPRAAALGRPERDDRVPGGSDAAGPGAASA